MSIEIRNSLEVIENICGDCDKKTSCVFGKPALKTLNMASFDNEKAAAISYIWDKRIELVIKACPRPETVSRAISQLKKAQG